MSRPDLFTGTVEAISPVYLPLLPHFERHPKKYTPLNPFFGVVFYSSVLHLPQNPFRSPPKSTFSLRGTTLQTLLCCSDLGLAMPMPSLQNASSTDSSCAVRGTRTRTRKDGRNGKTGSWVVVGWVEGFSA